MAAAAVTVRLIAYAMTAKQKSSRDAPLRPIQHSHCCRLSLTSLAPKFRTLDGTLSRVCRAHSTTALKDKRLCTCSQRGLPTLWSQASQAAVEHGKHPEYKQDGCLCVVVGEGLQELQVVLSKTTARTDPHLQTGSGVQAEQLQTRGHHRCLCGC